MTVKSRFEEFRAPGEDQAQERGWRVVRAAFGQGRVRRESARRRAPIRRLAAAAAGAVVVALVVTPAGSAVADWIEDVVDRDDGAAIEPLRLPTEGRLIVNTAAGPWIVNRDGSKRLLGNYGDASWSPQGLFVVAATGRELSALEPGGRIRWQIPTPARALSPRWAPSGFRIAYLTGSTLRVVAGDGTGDRGFARADAAPPAWRPGTAHVLAYADLRGRVVVADVDSKRTVWRSAPGDPVVELAWSADARRLVAASDHSLRVFDRRGNMLRVIRVPGPGPGPEPAARSLTFDRKGHDLALVRRDASGSEVVLLAAERGARALRQVFAGPGEVRSLAWSPDGRWLLIGWAGGDQWLYVSADAPRRVRAADRISQRFDPGAPGRPEFPGRAEWCC